MRTFKLISGVILVLAFCAFSVASASAEEVLWRWLPGPAKETLKGTSKEAKLQESKEGTKGGAAITCKKSEILLTDELPEGQGGTVHSELLEKEARLALAIIKFTECTVTGGLGIESLGDPTGTILTHLEIHNCLIKKGEQGLLIKPLPVHLEVLAVGLLISVEGDFVAGISKKAANEFELKAKQTEGKQAIEKCEGGKAETLLSKSGAEPQRPAAELVEAGILLFDLIQSKSEELLDES
jgi:hypothetical protein